MFCRVSPRNDSGSERSSAARWFSSEPSNSSYSIVSQPHVFRRVDLVLEQHDCHFGPVVSDLLEVEKGQLEVVSPLYLTTVDTATSACTGFVINLKNAFTSGRCRCFHCSYLIDSKILY